MLANLRSSFTSVSKEHQAYKDLWHLFMLSSPYHWVNFHSWCCGDISASHMSPLSWSMQLASSAHLSPFLWENGLRRCWAGTELLWKSILARRQRIGQGCSSLSVSIRGMPGFVGFKWSCPSAALSPNGRFHSFKAVRQKLLKGRSGLTLLLYDFTKCQFLFWELLSLVCSKRPDCFLGFLP